jgi:hypothetical protein
MDRLIEIRDMDKSNLTSSEKKVLRKEVKEIKKEVRKNQNGIYLFYRCYYHYSFAFDTSFTLILNP